MASAIGKFGFDLNNVSSERDHRMLGRAFIPQRVRQGNVLTKNTWKVSCSKCENRDHYEDVKSLPDEVVSKKFTQRGWLLGKSSRSHDVCPTCIGVRPENRLADRFKVSTEGSRVLTPTEMVHEAAESLFTKHKATDDILDRHFPSRLALPSPESIRTTSASPDPAPINLNSSDVGQLLINLNTTMGDIKTILKSSAVDLGDLRAAVELMAEQSAKTTGNTAQQIEAIARLGPLVSKNTDALAQGFALQRDTIIKTMGQSNPPVEVPVPDAPPSEPPPPIKAEGDPTTWTKDQLIAFAIDHLPTPKLKISPQPVLTKAAPPKAAPPKAAPPKAAPPKAAPPKVAPPKTGHPHDSNRTASAYSTVDKKTTDKYFTFIRIGREIWDQAGIPVDERVSIVVDGSYLKIRRAKDGRKIKTINSMSVLLQTYNIGNVNFKSSKPMYAKDGVTFKI